MAGFRLPLCKKCLTPQMYVLFLKCQTKSTKIFSPRPRAHSGAVEFMFPVLLDAFLYVRVFLHEDDRTLVYPYGDAAVGVISWFHDPLFLGNKKPASPFGGVGEKK